MTDAKWAFGGWIKENIQSMKAHLMFAFKVVVALFIANTIFSLLGSAGAQAKGLVNNGLPLGGLFGGTSSSS